jgi:hypothetical protein
MSMAANVVIARRLPGQAASLKAESGFFAGMK